MAYEPLVSPLAPSCNDFEPSADVPRNLPRKFPLETATPGMVLPAVLPQNKPPAGLKFLKSKNGNKASSNPVLEGMEEEATTPQSFLRKYWYVILPLFIMSLTSGGGGGGEEAAPHPSQQQQQEGAGEQAAVAPVAAASPSSQARASPGGDAHNLVDEASVVKRL